MQTIHAMPVRSSQAYHRFLFQSSGPRPILAAANSPKPRSVNPRLLFHRFSSQRQWQSMINATRPSLLPILHGVRNYKTWAAVMKAYLESEEVWEVVSGPPPDAATTSEIILATWTKKHTEARFVLLAGVSEDILRLIYNMGRASSIWAFLKTLYGGPQDVESAVLHYDMLLKNSSDLGTTELIQDFLKCVIDIDDADPSKFEKIAAIEDFLNMLENRLPKWVNKAREQLGHDYNAKDKEASLSVLWKFAAEALVHANDFDQARNLEDMARVKGLIGPI